MKFIELLQDRGIPTAPEGHHHQTRGWVNIDCPFCSPNTQRWRMGYNTRGNYVSCWSCGSHRLQETVAMLLDIPYREAAKLIQDIETIDHDDDPRPQGQLKLPRGIAPHLLEIHKRYLLHRGFKDPDAIERLWGIKGIGMSVMGMSYRIFIPIYFKGEVVSWTSRSVNDRGDLLVTFNKKILKYRSAKPTEEVVPHKHLLYGEHLCRQHTVIVNEGPLDAWAIGPGAVATLGMAYTSQQVARIARFPVRVVLFDAEPDAQTRAKRLVRDLEALPGETYNVTLTTGKDASRASPAELDKLRKRFLGESV